MQIFKNMLRLFESKEAKKQRLLEQRIKLRQNYRESLLHLRRSSLTSKEKEVLMNKLSLSFRALLAKIR